MGNKSWNKHELDLILIADFFQCLIIYVVRLDRVAKNVR